MKEIVSSRISVKFELNADIEGSLQHFVLEFTQNSSFSDINPLQDSSHPLVVIFPQFSRISLLKMQISSENFFTFKSSCIVFIKRLSLFHFIAPKALRKDETHLQRLKIQCSIESHGHGKQRNTQNY